MDKLKVELAYKLQAVIGDDNVLVGEELKNFSYTKTGGKAPIIVLPESEEQMILTVKLCERLGQKVLILGNGSNVIISDLGVEEVVIITERMKGIKQIDDTTVYVASGRNLAEFTKYLAGKDLTGMEFACGIPGSVGGAVFMNAGAYGGEMKDVLISALAVDKKGELYELNKDELELGYRHSVFQNNGMFILGAKVKLREGVKVEIVQRMNELNDLRAAKQPLEYPSCGSVFKRPEGYFAGKLIQEAGLQGERIGGVEVSKKHAGFMVNVGGGSAKDYKELIEYVQKQVFEKSGVKLEAEVKTIGKTKRTAV